MSLESNESNYSSVPLEPTQLHLKLFTDSCTDSISESQLQKYVGVTDIFNK